MMRKYGRLLRALQLAAAPGALLLLPVESVTAQNTESTASAYTPTMADWVAVNDVMYRYRLGVELHDEAALQNAFWPDGRNIAVPSPGVEIVMPLDGSPPSPPAGFTMPPPPGAGGPPPGGFNGPPPGGPPPGGFSGPPPGGFNGPPPGAGGPPGGDGYVVWHLPFESSFRFQSATRATHYQYFLSIYPEPEANDPGLAPRERRQSTVGWPGHYEDILEKRNGEWRILERRSYINAK
jgi:hypothetical protein